MVAPLHAGHGTTPRDLRGITADRLLAGTDLSRLTVPVLLVYSSGDEVCSPRAMTRFLARLPAESTRTAVFARSNHHLLHDHDREQAIHAIVDFVGRP